MAAGALLRYRVMAYVTGVVLAFGTAMLVSQLFGHVPDLLQRVVWTAHGWLYVVYVVTAFDLGFRRRWPLLGIVGAALAGTIPFCSFIAERRVVAHERTTSAPRTPAATR